VSILSTLSTQEFNNQLEQWEEQLKLELKLPEVGSKALKKTHEGEWPTLSLESRAQHLPIKEHWKKASQSYVHINPLKIEHQLIEDLEAGVRNFFFEKDFLKVEHWQKISGVFEKFNKSHEIDVLLLGAKEVSFTSPSIKLVDENRVAIGRTAHDHGGNIIQELGLMAFCLIQKIKNPNNDFYLGVFSDSQFFRNIAKIRAAKLLGYKVLQEAGIKKDLSVIALTSFREWTLYERYSNMLRNDVSVASSFIAGADHVQSSGYQSLFELEGVNEENDHGERSLRMARNTSHILALESMLGVVQDAAFGSYHLESLTNHYAEEAWKFMQILLPLSSVGTYIKEVARKTQELRLLEVKTRKHVLAGMNDFPDVKENLNLKENPAYRFFRIAHPFEAIRLKMEKVKRPEVYVALYGDYAALNGRLNFVKNYFELLGIKVRDPEHSQNDLSSFRKDLISRTEEIIVLCASDKDYPELLNFVDEVKQEEKFIAGKFEINGFKNLFAGQNIHQILEEIANRWGSK
jgi:hypothetical protein